MTDASLARAASSPLLPTPSNTRPVAALPAGRSIVPIGRHDQGRDAQHRLPWPAGARYRLPRRRLVRSKPKCWARAEVLGVDFDLPTENIAFLARALGSRARFESHSLYDLRPEIRRGVSTSCCCPVVVYHLRYPFLALRMVPRSAQGWWHAAGRNRDLRRCQPPAAVAPAPTGKAQPL
ncbi:MAG: hypothetical protein WDN69_23250 [Aliidongia sp.]